MMRRKVWNSRVARELSTLQSCLEFRTSYYGCWGMVWCPTTAGNTTEKSMAWVLSQQVPDYSLLCSSAILKQAQPVCSYFQMCTLLCPSPVWPLGSLLPEMWISDPPCASPALPTPWRNTGQQNIIAIHTSSLEREQQLLQVTQSVLVNLLLSPTSIWKFCSNCFVVLNTFSTGPNEILQINHRLTINH